MLKNTLLFFGVSVLSSAATGAEYLLTPGSELIGESRVITARYEDSFLTLARAHNVGLEELRSANPGVDWLLPGEGTQITIPTQHLLPRAPLRGIVVNVAELRLYYFPEGPQAVDPATGARRVYTYPISIGQLDWSTPLGRTTVTSKVKNPSWTPPDSIRAEHAERGDILPRVVPPGPDNPLGAHALRLGFPSYLIHGTNTPSGIGMRVTHGCIRMFPWDIEALFGMVPVGTPVQIVNQPFKVGWGPDGLYIEAHSPLEEHEDSWSATELTRAYVAATAERTAQVDWHLAEEIVQLRRGLPAFISTGAVEITAAAIEDETAL
jgi:L,D-transpeptidase ErfK/SrfK